MDIGNVELMHEFFNQTLAHDNSKNAIRKAQRTKVSEKSECGKKYSGQRARNN